MSHRPGTSSHGGAVCPSDVHLELSVPTSVLSNPGSAPNSCVSLVCHATSVLVSTLGDHCGTGWAIRGQHLAERLAAIPLYSCGLSSSLKVFLSPGHGVPDPLSPHPRALTPSLGSIMGIFWNIKSGGYQMSPLYPWGPLHMFQGPSWEAGLGSELQEPRPT